MGKLNFKDWNLNNLDDMYLRNKTFELSTTIEFTREKYVVKEFNILFMFELKLWFSGWR